MKAETWPSSAQAMSCQAAGLSAWLLPLMQSSGRIIRRWWPTSAEGSSKAGTGEETNYGQVNDDDDRIELAGQYFAGSVIEQAVRDWRKARASGFITKGGTIDGTMIQAYYKNSSNHKLPTYFDGPADLETLVTFFHGGGLEVWLAFGGLEIDPDIIVAGLDCIPARKAKIGHLMNNENQESGNYYVDMEGRTL